MMSMWIGADENVPLDVIRGLQPMGTEPASHGKRRSTDATELVNKSFVRPDESRMGRHFR